MKILIAEDDFTSRKYVIKLLSEYGECDVTVNGLEAIEAFVMAVEEEAPYDLVCLDVMMPKVDGLRVLKYIREKEEEMGLDKEKRVKVIITTALAEEDINYKTFTEESEVFLSKPMEKSKLHEVIKKFGLI
ncbi:MAG: response regulator [Deltaproteobacteria bacterium]